MAYQALYRKWRPEVFDDVIGQDAVMTTLKNQVISGRVGHAYLFCGTRGTGKTSAAKIFSRAVNCPHSKENGGNPCNSCEICTAIKDGRTMSVIEIDAASNNGVDNIRDIREEVQYPPVTGSYKVYIIDEVHMLSQGAFNALLKTLEEPPGYVIFILATTDPQRVPATILSRCQRYDFRRISPLDIERHLSDIVAREGLKAEPEALSYISIAADGSMRDALSILDQCMSFHYQDGLKYEDVLDILGTLDTEVFSKLFNEILEGDTEGALATVGDVLNRGADVLQLLNDFIWYLRDVLLSGNVKSDSAFLLDLSSEKLEMARRDYARVDKSRLIHILGSLAELTNRARFSPQKRVLLEVELIRLSTEGGQAETKSVLSQENKPASPESKMTPQAKIKSEDTLKVLKSNWQQMVEKLHPSNRPLFSQVVLKEENNTIVMLFKNNMNYRMAARNKLENGVLKLRELAKELTGHDVQLSARVAKERELSLLRDIVTDGDIKKIKFPVDIGE